MRTTRLDVTRREFLGATAMASVSFAAGAADATAKAAAGPWQIGCYTRPWAKYDYRIAFDAIAEAGFKYVGLMTTNTPKRGQVISIVTTPEEAQQIADECKKRDLKVPSAWGGDIGVEKSLENGIADMKHLVDVCAIAGVANILMGGVGKPELQELYYKAIKENCDYAAEKGIGVSVKPHGGTNSTGPQCRKLIESVNHKNFRLWYDPGNIFYYSDGKINPIDDAAAVDGIVAGMCVKDYRNPKIVDITPGTGIVDFPKVMARLAQGGFKSGALVVECLTPNDDPKKILEEAKKARAFVEKVVGVTA